MFLRSAVHLGDGEWCSGLAEQFVPFLSALIWYVYKFGAGRVSRRDAHLSGFHFKGGSESFEHCVVGASIHGGGVGGDDQGVVTVAPADVGA